MRASKIGAVDFFDDLTSPYARKWFRWGFIALCCICAILIYLTEQFVPGGSFHDVLNAIFIEVIAGVVIILSFYGLYTYFIGANTTLRDVSVTRPQDIGTRIRTLPHNVRHYTFWGRSGSFFRAFPLLELDRQAREQRKNIDIEVMMPDPVDPKLIESYQATLRSLGETPNQNALLVNVLATSLACAIIGANNNFISIKIFYSKFLPAFRLDLSDNGAMLTQDHPSKPALFFSSGSEFHEMFRTTFRNEARLSREVAWDEAIFKELSLEEKSCNKQTLNAFGIQVSDTDAIRAEVATLITERPHRYAR
jgi:hypothetical protein